MATQIRDIMTARVVTVRSGEPVTAAVERMTRYGFSALPVVTASNRLVGIVSLLDVLRHRQEGADRGVPVDEAGAAVDEIMTDSVLPIVEDGRLVGVLGRSDLV